jgi:hydroxymethylglutaryl-CoA lyase
LAASFAGGGGENFVLRDVGELAPSRQHRHPRMSSLVAAPKAVSVYEVGPRDGLQNEPRQVPTADKVKLIDGLAATGLKRIEITSFVNPRWIPQLADAVEVGRSIHRHDDVAYSCLVPNRQGLDRAIAAGMREAAGASPPARTPARRRRARPVGAAVAQYLRLKPVSHSLITLGLAR